MALSDVETALVAAAAAALYPAGTASPSAVGAACRVYRGWPVGDALDSHIAAGQVDVSVYSRPGMSKNTTRYPLQWSAQSIASPSFTVSVTGTEVTFSGNSGPSCLAGIQLGSTPYVYVTKTTDAPSDVAAGLAALAPGCNAVGSVLTAPGPVIARIGGLGTVSKEVRREWQELQVTVWSPTPELRDSVSAALDIALAQLPWLTLAEGSSARLLYHGQATSDMTSKAKIWRKDLFFGVEFGVSATAQAAQLLFADVSVVAS